MGYCGHYICDTDIDNWPSGMTDAEKEAAIRAAEEIIEAALGTQYYPKPFDIRINGNGKNRIFLPLKANILTVSHVYIYGVELEPSWYAFDHNSIYISPESAATDVELDYLLSEVEAEGIFPRGYNNIRIIGTYGQSPVPQWIKDCVIMLVKDKNDPSLYTHYLQSESIGKYSYNMGSDYLKGKLTGIKEVDDLIKLFRRGKPIMMTP